MTVRSRRCWSACFGGPDQLAELSCSTIRRIIDRRATPGSADVASHGSNDARSAAPRHNGPPSAPSSPEQHQEHQHGGNRDDHPHPWLHDSSPSFSSDPLPKWPLLHTPPSVRPPAALLTRGHPAESGVDRPRAHYRGVVGRRTPGHESTCRIESSPIELSTVPRTARLRSRQAGGLDLSHVEALAAGARSEVPDVANSLDESVSRSLIHQDGSMSLIAVTALSVRHASSETARVLLFFF